MIHMQKRIADRKGNVVTINVIVNISCIYTFCHILTPLLLSENLIRMAAPIIIDVEDESSDKENEAPEVATGHTASFEADRSGLSSISNLFHSEVAI